MRFDFDFTIQHYRHPSARWFQGLGQRILVFILSSVAESEYFNLSNNIFELLLFLQVLVPLVCKISHSIVLILVI